MQTRQCGSITAAYMYATSPHMFTGPAEAAFSRVCSVVSPDWTPSLTRNHGAARYYFWAKLCMTWSRLTLTHLRLHTAFSPCD